MKKPTGILPPVGGSFLSILKVRPKSPIRDDGSHEEPLQLLADAARTHPNPKNNGLQTFAPFERLPEGVNECWFRKR
jgi:hypothetical protein